MDSLWTGSLSEDSSGIPFRFRRYRWSDPDSYSMAVPAGHGDISREKYSQSKKFSLSNRGLAADRYRGVVML